MRELPRTTLKAVQKNLIPDGNRKKPPISNISPPKEITIRTPRESATSDLSSSRPNSTASEGGCSTDDDNNDGTTECSESGHESSSDEFGGENRAALDPISEEASLHAKRSEDDGYLIVVYSFLSIPFYFVGNYGLYSLKSLPIMFVLLLNVLKLKHQLKFL